MKEGRVNILRRENKLPKHKEHSFCFLHTCYILISAVRLDVVVKFFGEEFDPDLTNLDSDAAQELTRKIEDAVSLFSELKLYSLLQEPELHFD